MYSSTTTSTPISGVHAPITIGATSFGPRSAFDSPVVMGLAIAAVVALVFMLKKGR